MSGAGYDIVPSDCLARHVADRVPGATQLETALVALADLSSGTVKSALVNANRYPGGSLTRRDGRLVPSPLGKGRRKVRFSDGRVREVSPFPWGDLVTAYHTTGIANITTYLALPALPGMGLLSRPALKVLGQGAVQRVADRAATWFFTGPDEEAQRKGRTYLWARAAGPSGAAEAWLETGEVYRFTALTLAFGVMADRVWLPWWLTPARLLRWLPAAAAALPWLLAAGVAQQGDAGRVDLRLGQQGGVGGVEVALQAAVVETGAGRAVAVKVEQHDAVAGAGQWLAEAEHERRRTGEAVGDDDRRNASRARRDEEQQRLAIGPAQAPALQPARPRQHAPPGQPNEQQGGGDQGETKGAKTGEQMGATRQR